jgi:DNA-binding FadR family transcriptional regulator
MSIHDPQSNRSNWTMAVNSDRYGSRLGSYHTRKHAFQKAHSEVLDHIQRGNADAAYSLVRLLVGLARTTE